MDVCVSYRGHGDRDVKVLGSVVLLEAVDVKPNLRDTDTHTQVKTKFLQGAGLHSRH